MSFLMLIALIFIGAPIGRAIAARIAAGTELGSADGIRTTLEDIEHRLIGTEQRLDDALERLSENEERLDFAERLLTRMNSQDQLKPGN